MNDDNIDVSASTVRNTTVRLLLLAAIHQKKDLIVADIENAYLNAETTEKVYTKLGDGFGIFSNRVVRIVRALHGLVSLGRCFQGHLRSALRNFGIRPSMCNENLWILQEKDGSLTCISAFVDNLMICSNHIPQHLTQLKSICSMKVDTNLICYLGMDLVPQTQD